jgi:hypothetical protein
MAMETKHVIVLEDNKEHCVQIKNTYYSCRNLTYILNYFNKLNCILLLLFSVEKWGVWLILGHGMFEKIRYC